MSRKKGWTWLPVSILLIGGCSDSSPDPQPKPSTERLLPQTAVRTHAIQQKPTPEPVPTHDPVTDVGTGKPGAFCAISRLGASFTKNGVVYTCKGPKPYRWRRVS